MTQKDQKAHSYQTFDLVREGTVEWVTFNRPERGNAINDQMVDDLLTYFDRLLFDQSVRIVVLRGAGKNFCVGLDLKSNVGFAADPKMGGPGIGMVRQRRIAEIAMRMRRVPQPIVCLIQGAACGGGFALTLASDIRIAGESARMNSAAARIGLSGCDIGMSYFLTRMAGSAIAAELLLTGRFINAQRAERVGLVSEVVPDHLLAEAAKPYIDEMLATSPLSLRLTKECLTTSMDAPNLEAVVAMEDRTQIVLTQTEDVKEGLTAFMQKRPPRYQDL